jgi:hypothetical protein
MLRYSQITASDAIRDRTSENQHRADGCIGYGNIRFNTILEDLL